MANPGQNPQCWGGGQATIYSLKYIAPSFPPAYVGEGLAMQAYLSQNSPTLTYWFEPDLDPQK